MAKTQKRVTIRANGKTPRLISMHLSKHDDLIIAIRSGDKWREPGVPRGAPADYPHDADVKEHRYTIHPSPGLPEGNRINIHHVFRDGHHETLSGFTPHIKSAGMFVPLASRLGAEPSSVASQITGNAINISLGEYDEHAFALHTTILISHPDAELTAGHKSLNVKTMMIGNYKLTLLWSFIPQLGLPIGLTAFCYSGNEDNVVELGAFSAGEVFEFHEALSSDFYEETVDTMLAHVIVQSVEDMVTLKKGLLSHFYMFKNGSTDTDEFRQYMQKRPSLQLDRQIHIGLREFPDRPSTS